MTTVEFQIMVLAAIRDLYTLKAMSAKGRLRENLISRSETYQNLVDELMEVTGGDVRE